MQSIGSGFTESGSGSGPRLLPNPSGSGSRRRFFFHDKDNFLWSKTVKYFFLNPYKGHSALLEASSPTENSSNMKFLHFYLFVVCMHIKKEKTYHSSHFSILYLPPQFCSFMLHTIWWDLDTFVFLCAVFITESTEHTPHHSGQLTLL